MLKCFTFSAYKSALIELNTSFPNVRYKEVQRIRVRRVLYKVRCNRAVLAEVLSCIVRARS